MATHVQTKRLTSLSVFSALCILLGSTLLTSAALPSDLSEVSLDLILKTPDTTSLEGIPFAPEDLIDTALVQNLALLSAHLVRREAEANLQAMQGTFEPGFSTSGGITRQRMSADNLSDHRTIQSYEATLFKEFGLGARLDLQLQTTRDRIDLGRLGGQTAYETDLSASLTQPLLEGWKISQRRLRISHTASQAAGGRADRALELSIASIQQSYWSLAEAEAVEGVMNRSLKVAQVLLFRNTELHARELASEMDVLTAQSGVALRKANLIDAQLVRVDAAEALVFLAYGENASRSVHANPRPIKTLPTTIDNPELPDFAEAETQALSARRDYKAMRRDLKGARISLAIARSALRPKLDLLARVGTGRPASSLSSTLSGLNDNLSLFGGIVLSNFIGNSADRGRYNAADLRVEALRLDLVARENSVRQEVRRAIRAINASRERLVAAEQAADLARRQLKAEEKRLELGIGDSFRILETEENTAQAEVVAVRVRFALTRAITSYNLALGRIAKQYL
jgi:outer membrane protein TolC